MMFIVRAEDGTPSPAGVQVKTFRRTPEFVPEGANKTDYFCVGEKETITTLRAEGWDVVELRDGWYAGDADGGVGISGQGRYWEVRDTPFTVKESVVAADAPVAVERGEEVNVRKAIFGV